MTSHCRELKYDLLFCCVQIL